jgi:hypothetical protein
MRALTLIVLAALLVPAVVHAQDRFPPQAGTRVRISAPSLFLYHETGFVNDTDPYGVFVRLDDHDENVRVPYFDVARLEVSRGKTKLTVWGALGGALLGATLGAATTPFPEPRGFDDFEPLSTSDGDPFGRMVVGAMIGGAFGGLLGSAVEVERWEPVFTARRRFD